MTTRRLASLAVALACILAFGVASTTLESTVSTDPADVIDLGADQQIVGGASAGAIRDQIESNKRGDDEQAQVQERKPKSGGQRQQAGKRDGGSGNQLSQAQGPDQGQGPGGPTDSLLDALLDLLRRLAALLPLVAVAALVGAAYRYRGRLAALLWSVLPASASRRTRDDPWAGADPGDVVERAWFEMVRHLDVDRPRSKTPAECAVAAREADMDPEGVRLVTRAFRDAQYGEGRPTEEQRERARRGLSRLGIRGGGAR